MVFQESNTCLCVCLDYGEQTLYDTGLLEPAVNVVTKLLSPWVQRDIWELRLDLRDGDELSVECFYEDTEMCALENGFSTL